MPLFNYKNPKLEKPVKELGLDPDEFDIENRVYLDDLRNALERCDVDMPAKQLLSDLNEIESLGSGIEDEASTMIREIKKAVTGPTTNLRDIIYKLMPAIEDLSEDGFDESDADDLVEQLTDVIKAILKNTKIV